MANYTTIDKPSDYFNTLLYTGTGSSNAVTGVGFSPGWTWIKSRTATEFHRVIDVVRGAEEEIYTNSTDKEFNEAQGLKSFNSDGFTLGTTAGYNGSNKTFVSWNWKTGTSFTNDASSTSVGTIDSAGSVNTDAGFSIQTWTGTGSGGTIAHGLGAVPGFMIVKNRSDDGRNWPVYFGDRTKYMYLSSTDAQANAGTIIWNDTTPTSTVFSVGDDNGVNESGKNYVGYVFAEKQGYSKTGSYTGNGNVDGAFVYTGFKPAFVLTRAIAATENWPLFDNKRDIGNVVTSMLRTDSNQVEDTSDSYLVDFLSNGFKWRASDGKINGDGAAYIFLAFAENPFVTSTGIPTTAR